MKATVSNNYLNIFLMALAAAATYVMPFELLILSYAFLGPAHYLTEISWLHDRKYFMTDARQAFILIALAFLAIYIAPGAQGLLVWLCLVVACTLVFFKDRNHQIAFGFVLGFSYIILSLFENFNIALLYLLPTIIHVYIFTGAFMLLGALRDPKPSTCLAIFAFCRPCCIKLPLSELS